MSLESIVRVETAADRVAIEIKMELAKRGQSQAALARALDVPAMWVSDRLSGKVQMTVNDLARIADAFGLGIRDLLPTEHSDSGSYLRKRRPPDLVGAAAWAPPAPREPAVSGTVAHPGHPIASGAVRIPTQRGPNGVRKTAPTGR